MAEAYSVPYTGAFSTRSTAFSAFLSVKTGSHSFAVRSFAVFCSFSFGSSSFSASGAFSCSFAAATASSSSASILFLPADLFSLCAPLAITPFSGSSESPPSSFLRLPPPDTVMSAGMSFLFSASCAFVRALSASSIIKSLSRRRFVAFFASYDSILSSLRCFSLTSFTENFVSNISVTSIAAIKNTYAPASPMSSSITYVNTEPRRPPPVRCETPSEYASL